MDRPKEDTKVVVSGQDFETIAKNAAEQAASDAQEMMETVMREAIRMLRDELRGEIRQAEAPNDLRALKERVSAMGDHVHALQAKLSQHQVAQWKNANKEQVEQQISDLYGHVKTESAKHATKEHVDKQIADLLERLAQADSATGAVMHRLPEMESQVQEMQAQAPGRTVWLEYATHSDLEVIKESMTSLLQAQEVASKEQLDADRHISQLRTDLSQIKGEQILSELRITATNDDLSEMRGQMQAMQTRVSGTVTCGDLEAFRESALREVRENAKDIREHVEMKMSELHKPKAPLEANAQPGFSDLESMKSQMHPMQKQMLEHNELSEVENSSAVEAIKHLDKMMSEVQEHLYKVKRQQEATVLELREDGEANKESMSKQISDLHSHMSEIKEYLAQRTDKSGRISAEVELEEEQRKMNEYMYNLSEVVDGSSKLQEEWLAKLVALEHDVEELRSETKSLRIAVMEEQFAVQV